MNHNFLYGLSFRLISDVTRISFSLKFNFNSQLELLNIQFYLQTPGTQACNLFARNYYGMKINGLLNCDDCLFFHHYKYVLDHYDRVLVLEKQITQFSHFIFCICD